MPAAVQTYIDKKDISSVQMKQKEILSLQMGYQPI